MQMTGATPTSDSGRLTGVTSTRRDYVGVPDEQTPGIAVTLPNVREAAPYRLTRLQTVCGRVADRYNSLKAHRRREITVDANELDASLERREVDDACLTRITWLLGA